MIQVIEQTHEEKMAMYMKEPKKDLAAMLIQCNKLLDAQLQVKTDALFTVNSNEIAVWHVGMSE